MLRWGHSLAERQSLTQRQIAEPFADGRDPGAVPSECPTCRGDGELRDGRDCPRCNR